MHKPPRVPSFRRSLTQTTIALLVATALGIAACGGGGGGNGGNERPLDSDQTASDSGRVSVLGAALNAPWGLAFLPDGRMLVTEKAGTLALVSADGASVQRIGGVPTVAAAGQGGLLDVAVHNGWVYLAYAEPGAGGNGTALGRGQLNGATLQNFTRIWQQTPKLIAEGHYGARIALRSDGTLYLAVGERFYESNDGTARADGVQNATNTLGKVMRLNADGSVPADNPSFGAGAAPGLWSMGHRNPQGAAVRPGSNDLWITEHGPQGGDELNAIAPGGNYGWPVRSYGCAYGAPVGAACRISADHSGYTEPKAIWVPESTAPSGLMFYTGSQFPQWQGNVFSGALAGQTLWRIVLDGNGNAVSRQEIAAVKALNTRIRDVRQGPDGNIYLLTNTNNADGSGGRIVRLQP
jgi:aldose sugar dehydrogenase